MPRPYSTDLRERALAACEAGEGGQAEVAGRFRVGAGERALSGWLRAAREEGRREPKPRGGRPGGRRSVARERRWPGWWSRSGTTRP